MSPKEYEWEVYCYDVDDAMCSRCGRWNHHVMKCYAKRDIYGFKIYRPRRDRLFGAIKKATR